MQKVLSKRVFRDLKSNFLRYIALFLLIVLGMYIVISVVAAAETILIGVEEGQEENALEDGCFSVFVPLSDEELSAIEDAGAELEQQFYMDYNMEDGSEIRVYRNRERMNLISVWEGRSADSAGEVLVEHLYADAKDLSLGDELIIGGEAFTIVGTGSTPDYDGMYKNLSDASIDHETYGNVFVCTEDYERLREAGKSSKAEEYVYSYRLNGDLTDEDLKGTIKELADGHDMLPGEYFLLSFVTSEDNTRHGASMDDVQINKDAGILAGIVAMILFTYVISVFVIHSIEQEITVIGALYALGVKRKQLMFHYILLPVIVTLLGGAVGTLLGFSPIGAKIQMQESFIYFSMPKLEMQYPLYLILYGVVMPPVAAAIVNYFVISGKLRQTALSMIRNEQKSSKIKDVNLGKMGFVRRFQIRQMLRELRSGITVVLGMFLSLLVLMLGLNCYALCSNYKSNSDRDTTYEYMYSFKYPEAEVPSGGEACYVEKFKKEALGIQLEVAVIGIDEDNKYFDVKTGEYQNDIVISEAVASKFDVKVGDKLVLSDDVNNRDYAFTVKSVMPFATGLYTFMDIDAMRELFGREEGYYNMVLSDVELDIAGERLYATMSRENVIKNSEVFINLRTPMITVMTSIAVIIFVVVMYLMMKVMIDRSSFSIALMKIFGYRKREIKRLYLDGNLIIVAVGAAVCIPLTKLAMNAMYPYLCSNVGIALDLAFSPWLYALIYGGVIICYLIINRLLVGRLKRMVPAEILKNRE